MNTEETLKSYCTYYFGGIGAISPEIYQVYLEEIAKLSNRECNEEFKKEVSDILKTFPSIFD